MLGSALGDAIGELGFRTGRQNAVAILHARMKEQEYLRYTDDTAMAIGIAESLTSLGKLDQQHLGDTFRNNFDKESWRGYAEGPPTIFWRVKREKITYREAASSLFHGSGSFGNGAAMRITPVGLFFYNATDLYNQVETSATVTHAHPLGVDGAAVLAMAIAEAVQSDPADELPVAPFIEKLVAFARTQELRDKMALVYTLLSQKIPPFDAGQQLKLTVAAHESVPFAIYSFLSHPKSYEECLYCASLHGGDRDTMGAMASAISGAYLGVEAIPRPWLEKLENRAYLEELTHKMVDMLPRSSQ
jgi:poly(ADP-ribose) glycohydrolase ARH3